MNPTKTTPHVRLTVNDLKEQYLTGKLTVKGYIYNWILASRKCGWKLKTKVKDFCQELGISRSAFYKAIAELKTEPGSRFHFEVPDGEIEMWIDDPTEDAVHDRGHPSMTVDTPSMTVDTPSMTMDTPSMTMENQTPKPAHSKASTAPSSISHLYTTYIQGEKKSLNANKQPMDPDPIGDPGSDSDLDLGGDLGSDSMRDLEPTGDPGKFTQSAPHHSHNKTMDSLGSNSLGSNDQGREMSWRMGVARMLEDVKRELMERVEWQRSQRSRLGKVFLPTGVSPVGTQGSYLTPGPSDPSTTST